MAKKIEPSQVAAQCKWDIGELEEFCADALEDANDHNIAAALRAIAYGAYDIAIGFIKLNEDQDAAGELTPELSERRRELSEQLEEYLDETGD